MFGVRVGAVAVVVVAVSGVCGAPDAVARQRLDLCGGSGHTHVVKRYSRGAARLPLRCGTATWGYRHITHRWNAAFDREIALTIARGDVVQDLQGDGGSAIYALFDRRCKELFRVIYNGGAYRGTGVRPQGIITAYYRTSANVRLRAPERRRPCAIYQDI